VLKIESLTKTFDETIAVNNVTLEIPAGSMVGIIGRSGAGKSTLLRMINRLSEPSAGSISWKGVPISSLNGAALRSWRARCGMVFQQFNLAPRLDVLTNVLIGALSRRPALETFFKVFPQEERARAILELHALDMADKALQRACTLSGGQQQRVAIARTLMQNPEIILADEPIASLDPANAETVMEALRRINEERSMTVLVNLHTLDVARRFCPRIIAMAHGEVIFDGTPEALNASVVDQIYGRKMSPSDTRYASPKLEAVA
jgi:phosphonate transport system ATP-binding protein